MPPRRGSHIDRAHQPGFGMIEDVAVIHPAARALVEAHRESDGPFEGYVYGIPPGERPNGCAILVQHLEEVPVKMKRMRPLGLVDDGPDLRLAEGRRQGAAAEKRLAVDAVLERLIRQLLDRQIDGHRGRAGRRQRIGEGQHAIWRTDGRAIYFKSGDGLMEVTVAAGPTFANGITKTQLNQEWSMSLDQAIEAEAQAQAICMQTEDFKRAYRAFVAKQKPVFEGN